MTEVNSCGDTNADKSESKMQIQCKSNGDFLNLSLKTSVI